MSTPMTAARARFIPELLDTHFEELEYLWGQRRAALHSSLYTLRSFADLTERVEAHIQGLLAVPTALPALLLPRLESEDREGVFAAACPLLRLSDSTQTAAILAAFASAQGPRLAGLRDALSFAPSGQFVMAMRQSLERAEATQAVAAAVVLANQRLLDPASPRLASLLTDESAEIAELAWLATTEADTRSASSTRTRPYQAALAHADPRIRNAALYSAAWTGQSWTLAAVRQIAAANDEVGLNWLAVLGHSDDLPALLSHTASLANPAKACRLLARLGHPGVMASLGRSMASTDIALAAEAGEAFTLITGFDVRGQRQTAATPADADEFAREFAPLVWTPDISKAQIYWQQHGSTLSSGTRWRQGLNLGEICPAKILAELDLQARWDAGARAALAGQALCSPPPIFG